MVAKPTARADLLLNIDVLEHIEQKDLDAVLADMAGTCRDALIIIDTKPAATILADGRNAHTTIRPHAWWRQRLARHFPELHAQPTARSWRAGFRTWTHLRRQTPAYLCARGRRDPPLPRLARRAPWRAVSGIVTPGR